MIITHIKLKAVAAITLFFCCIAIGMRAQDQAHLLIAKGAVLSKLSNQYSFTEGPAVDKHGNIFFTDQPNNKIIKWNTNGKLSVFMENSGRSNGLYFDRQGNLWACADESNQLWKIDKNKKVTVVVNSFEGQQLNGPNDLWIDPKGGIYFTDPYYQRNYWIRKNKEIEDESVYYLSPDKKRVTKVADDFLKPNGIIGTPDGKKLYVADIKANKTFSFTINADGSLSKKTLFTELGSDGMTIDETGNIYLTGKGVTIFNPQGEKITHINVPEPWTANVCFGGKKLKRLFITASKAVYTLDMNVKGGLYQ